MSNTNSPTRRTAAIEYEAARAMLSLAGIRQLYQTSLTVNANALNSYVVLRKPTRRVIVLHLSSGNSDITFSYSSTSDPSTTNTPASSTSMPVLPTRYFVIDAAQNDTINFSNNTGGNITVFLMEIE